MNTAPEHDPRQCSACGQGVVDRETDRLDIRRVVLGRDQVIQAGGLAAVARCAVSNHLSAAAAGSQ